VSFAGAIVGSGNLDKAGVGRLSVGNASSGYTGTFTISAGTLEITAANAFANATLSQTGGTLLLAPQGGGDALIPDLGGSGGVVTIDTGANGVFGGNSNRGYDGRIRGQGAFKKEGNGTLTLNADNDFAGNTRIAQGRLKLGASGTLSATPRIDIDSGAIFDVADKSGFALGTGQRLGGKGTVLGSLEFGSGSQFAFDPTGPLLVGSGTVSFAAGFGIGSIFGLDATVAEGTYTLLNETTGGSISFANLANVGPGSPFDLGGGKAAYFQQGSLQVVVVPEPDTFFIGGLGLALAGLATCRHRRRRSCPAA
jgi:autotransporter-associated beta strand protein